MAPSLLLHVGDFKTGTSSIQACLRDGLYGAPDGPGIDFPEAALIPVVRALQKGRDDAEAAARLAAAVRGAQAGLVVLSAEHFQMVRPRRLRGWLERHLPEHAETCRLICYVRPHAEFLLATYAEQTKLGVTREPFERYIDGFLQTRRMIFRPRFEAWRRAFGDRLLLRPMVRSALSEGDVVQDFLDHATGGRATATRQVRTNRSLGLHDLGLLRRYNAWLAWLGLTDKARRWLANRLQDALEARPDPGQPRLALSADQLERVRRRCGADAAAMDAAFFEGTPLSDALAAARPGPAAVRVPRLPSRRQAGALMDVGPTVYARWKRDRRARG